MLLRQLQADVLQPDDFHVVAVSIAQQVLVITAHHVRVRCTAHVMRSGARGPEMVYAVVQLEHQVLNHNASKATQSMYLPQLVA